MRGSRALRKPSPRMLKLLTASLIPAPGAIASHCAGEIDLRIVRHCARGRPPETEFIPPQLIRRRSVAEGVSPNFSR